jgi:hypothetical protein
VFQLLAGVREVHFADGLAVTEITGHVRNGVLRDTLASGTLTTVCLVAEYSGQPCGYSGTNWNPVVRSRLEEDMFPKGPPTYQLTMTTYFSLLLLCSCGSSTTTSRVTNEIPLNFFTQSCEAKLENRQIVAQNGGYELWLIRRLSTDILLYGVGRSRSDCFLTFEYIESSIPLPSYISDEPALVSYHNLEGSTADSNGLPQIAFYREVSDQLTQLAFGECAGFAELQTREACLSEGSAWLDEYAVTLSTVYRATERDIYIVVDLVDSQYFVGA